MTTFRCKTKKASFVTTKETLHSRHNDMVKQFRANKKQLAGKKKQLKDMNHKLSLLKKEEDSPEKTASIIELNENLAALNLEIKKIEENEEEDKYYMNNGEIIFRYFQNIDDLANEPELRAEDSDDDEDDSPEVVPEDPGEKKSVMDFFKPQVVSDVKPAPVSTDTVAPPDPLPRGQSNMASFVQVKENFKRAKMLDKYMSNIDPTHVITLDRETREDCPDCKGEMHIDQHEGLTVCLKCGYSEAVKIDSDKRSYKEATNTEMSYIAYKRINHFEHSRECKSMLKMSFMLVPAPQPALVACAA